MGRVATILQLQWRAYWRRFVRPGNLTTSNEGILLIVSILALFKYFSALRIAGYELANGKYVMFEKLLFGIFIVWLFPLLSNARLNISIQTLRQFPISLKELFAIRIGSLFVPVFVWVIAGASLALMFPLSKAPSALAGTAAVFLLIVSSFFFGLTLAQLLSLAFWRRLILVATLIALAGFAVYVARTGDLIQAARGLSFVPVSLVVNVVIGRAEWWTITSLLALVVTSVCAAFWSFRVSLDGVGGGGVQKSRSFTFFPGKTGPLIQKECRYFRKLLDYYIGTLASAIGCLYLLINEVPGNEVFWVFIILVFFANVSMAFNSFGFDYGPGWDRYTLFPLSGREVLKCKNVAFITLIGIQLAPMFVLALWRLGLVPVLFGMVEVALLGLAYLTCGNIFSVYDRFRMEFYRFSSGGSPIDGLVGVVLSTLPAGIAIKFFGGPFWWIALVMLILCFALYSISLVWSGRRIERFTLSGRYSVTVPR